MRAFHTAFILTSFIALASCTENPATGQRQFTALMPTSQEASVGADGYKQAVAEYGIYDDKKLQAYVTQVGQKLVPVTERQDVTYTFTVLDSPILNAFALPGGYVFVTRGLMAWANSESELAAVMGHEIGHVNARHSAARYSQAAVAQIGLELLGAVVKTPIANQAAGVGTKLYLSQYSQSQENEADMLGIRYNAKTGYDPMAMSDFLKQLNRNDAFEAKYKGRQSGSGLNQFFADHPQTADRVARSAQEATQVTPAKPLTDDSIAYLKAIQGMAYGASTRDGYVKGTTFVHPVLGFAFDVPAGYVIENGKSSVTAQGSDGVAIIFDMANKGDSQSVRDYLYSAWSGGRVNDLEDITINGAPAATAVAQAGTVNGKPVSLRIVAIQGPNPTQVYRFQYAIPLNLAGDMALQERVQASARSFHILTEAERQTAPRQRIVLVAAQKGDSAESLSAKMDGASADERAALFRAINGMDDGQPVQVGHLYKLVQ